MPKLAYLPIDFGICVLYYSTMMPNLQTADNLPDPAVILKATAPATSLIYEALENGFQQTRTFFDGMGKPINRFLFPNLVRYFVKEHLTSAGQDVIEEEETEVQSLEMANIANNGLFMVFGGYQIRILKADRGGLPHPGHSRAKRGFYAQQSSFFPLLNGELRVTSLNLVVLWDNLLNHSLAALRMVCPKDCSGDPLTIDVYFNEAIPHPATLAKPKSSEAARIGRELDDLDEMELTGQEQVKDGEADNIR